MFTGLIQHVGRVASVTPVRSGVRLVVDVAGWTHEPAAGDSIAVSGCCLTVVEARDGAFAFDVVPRSLEITTLGGLAVDSPVNLEHAATPTTLLGGHLVQGHVDAVGEVIVNADGPEGWRLEVRAPEDVARYLVDRGSITIEGVSLTVARIDDHERFSVFLVPTTLEHTTLARLVPGDSVNLEADAIGKMVATWIERSGALPRG